MNPTTCCTTHIGQGHNLAECIMFFCSRWVNYHDWMSENLCFLQKQGCGVGRKHRCNWANKVYVILLLTMYSHLIVTKFKFTFKSSSCHLIHIRRTQWDEILCLQDLGVKWTNNIRDNIKAQTIYNIIHMDGWCGQQGVEKPNRWQGNKELVGQVVGVVQNPGCLAKATCAEGTLDIFTCKMRTEHYSS